MRLFTLACAPGAEDYPLLKFPTRFAESPEDYVIDIILRTDISDHTFHNFMTEVGCTHLPVRVVERLVSTGYDADTNRILFKDPETQKVHCVSVPSLMKRIDAAAEPNLDGIGESPIWLLYEDEPSTCLKRWHPAVEAEPTEPTETADVPSPAKRTRVEEAQATATEPAAEAAAEAEIDLTCDE